MRVFLLFLALMVVASVGGQIRVANDIYNCEIIDDKLISIGDISLSGNDVTRDKIIFRELEFQTGQQLTFSKLCELASLSRENLLNRSLFNFVYLDLIPDTHDQAVINIKISVIERWYIWPLPIFELADRNFNVWWQTKDFNRVNYGAFITHNNFRGRMEKLQLLLRAGYNQNYSLLYEIPYLTAKQNFGIGIEGGYSRSREIAYKTIDNEQLHFKNESKYAQERLFLKALFSYRIGYRHSHLLYLSYDRYSFADTLTSLNPDFMAADGHKSSFLALQYIFKHDFRDNKAYPIEGHYFDFEFMRFGFGCSTTSPDFHYAKSTFDWYTPIAGRWYWASSVTAKFSGGKTQPYYLRKALGFQNDFVRSYELYVIDGDNFGIFKNNLKFNVIKPKVRNLPLIPTEKFSKIHYAAYLNLFLDMGYAGAMIPDPTNSLNNKLLIGTGIGLDLVTYYDMVFRFEYSRNRLNEFGFFIHFMAPI
ncbi:MAG: hypothetical protein PHP48_07745 [Bacteroidales bacterium]|nr:hypothetical protein [Bacteroidales bacterium]